MPEHYAYTWPHVATIGISTSAVSKIKANQLKSESEIRMNHRKSASLLQLDHLDLVKTCQPLPTNLWHGKQLSTPPKTRRLILELGEPLPQNAISA